MNKILFLLGSLSFSFSYAYGQDVLINGRILNNDDLAFIPFSTIEIQNLAVGTVADAEGFFSISIPSERLDDSLLVKSLGFQDTVISIRSLPIMDTVQILLRPQSYELIDIEVRPRQDFAILGTNLESARTGYVLLNWMQIAVYLANDNNNSPAVLKSASFYIGKNPKPQTPFRIRIYAVNKDGSPGEDLLKESLIIAGEKADEWVDVDLFTYQISFPGNGLFVAMEWILSDRKYYYTEKMGNRKFSFYGQKLGNAVVPVEEQNTWIYRLGSHWELDDKIYTLRGKKYGRNALVRCKLQFLE